MSPRRFFAIAGFAPAIVAFTTAAATEVAPAVERSAIDATTTVAGTADSVTFYLTVLHNNDGESQLIDAGSGLEDFGGVARFKTVVDALKRDGRRYGGSVDSGVVMISSGDNFLAGPEFNASIERGLPFYDSIAMDLIGYDAVAIGNHEFDFGPDVLAEFIVSFITKPTFVSANLNFALEPTLNYLANRLNRIAPAKVLNVQGRRVGVIGLTTPTLPFVSSPRNVIVNDDLVGVAQSAIDALTSRGVEIIIITSHLQDLNQEFELVSNLRGVDLVVGGGGGELIANPDDLLVPGDSPWPTDLGGTGYPRIATDLDGNSVPVVTTSGDYRYVGRLIVGFDADGALVEVDSETSGPVRVAGGANPDAVAPDPVVKVLVTDPVQASIDALAANVIAISEVNLNGVRADIRGRETNLGNMVADSYLWQASVLAPQFGVPRPQVAIANGGGIRNNTIIAPGDFTELNTFDILPFSNFICIAQGIAPDQFKEILENCVSQVEFGNGRFGQVSGFNFVYDPNGTAQVLDADLNVVTPGTRIVSATLWNGTRIIENGAVVPGAPNLNVATVDFLARGGDQYPFRDAPFTTLGVSYQLGLENYVQEFLGGIISAEDYPEGGEGRILTIGN